jgi:ketosteroid isomerase-like protein
MNTKALMLSAKILFAIAVLATCNRASADETKADETKADETKAVEQATAQFYTSLNVMFTGDVGPMLEVWSHADDVSYMGPGGGILSGWTDVRRIWESQAALKLGGTVKPYDLRVTVGNDLAFTQCVEKGSNQDAEGRTVQVSIRATNIFRKENGQWKMIGHHTDPLPFLQQQVEPQTVNTSAE